MKRDYLWYYKYVARFSEYVSVEICKYSKESVGQLPMLSNTCSLAWSVIVHIS